MFTQWSLSLRAKQAANVTNWHSNIAKKAAKSKRIKKHIAKSAENHGFVQVEDSDELDSEEHRHMQTLERTTREAKYEEPGPHNFLEKTVLRVSPTVS